jgi:hypothetical protein
MEEENQIENNSEEEITAKDKKIYEMATGQDVDWEAIEQREKAEKIAEADYQRELAEQQKKEKEEFIEKNLNSIDRIKLEMNYKDDEVSWLVEKAKIDKVPLKKVLADSEVQDLIQYRRKMNAPKIPWVLGKKNDDHYLSTSEFAKKYKKIIK